MAAVDRPATYQQELRRLTSQEQVGVFWPHRITYRRRDSGPVRLQVVQDLSMLCWQAARGQDAAGLSATAHHWEELATAQATPQLLQVRPDLLVGSPGNKVPYPSNMTLVCCSYWVFCMNRRQCK